jgi:hypothetical protein
MLRKTLLVAALTSSFLSFSALAATVTLGGDLTPDQEAPGIPNTVGFDPSGFVLASLDTDTGAFAWLVTYTGLTTAVNNAHFHGPAVVGSATGAQIDIRDEAAGANSAAENVDVILGSLITSTSGTFMGTATLDSTQMSDLLGGLWGGRSSRTDARGRQRRSGTAAGGGVAVSELHRRIGFRAAPSLAGC